MRDLYRGNNDFQKGYQPGASIVKDENGDLVTDSPIILAILGGSVRAIKNTEALVVANKEIELEVNADKSKYMVMYGDQNGRSHTIKIDNSPLKGWNSSNI